MIHEAIVWLIFLLPLGSFLAIALFIRPFFNHHSKLAGRLTILSVGVGLILSVWTIGSVVINDDLTNFESWAVGHIWIEVGNLGAYGQTLATQFNGFYSDHTIIVTEGQ